MRWMNPAGKFINTKCKNNTKKALTMIAIFTISGGRPSKSLKGDRSSLASTSNITTSPISDILTFCNKLFEYYSILIKDIVYLLVYIKFG